MSKELQTRNSKLKAPLLQASRVYQKSLARRVDPAKTRQSSLKIGQKIMPTIMFLVEVHNTCTYEAFFLLTR